MQFVKFNCQNMKKRMRLHQKIFKLIKQKQILCNLFTVQKSIHKMLKFLTPQKSMIKRKQLLELQIIGEKFKNFKHNDIRAYIRTLSRMKMVREQFNEIFSIFYSLNEKKCPFQTLKILIFFHLMIQESPQICEDIVLPQINKLQEQINISSKDIRGKSRSVEKPLSRSVEKVVSWFKDKFSSQEKFKKMQSSRLKKTHDTQEEEVLTKQLFIMTKIINPYFAYLIRSLSLLNFYQKCSKGLKIQYHEIWILTNILKNLFRICSSFTHIFRYYLEQLFDLLISVRDTIIHEINFIYPVLKLKIEECLSQVTRKYEKQSSLVDKNVEVLEEFIKVNQVYEIKNMLDEISSINESMKYLFFAKYYSRQMRMSQLIPKFIKTDNDQCELLFHLFSLQKKQLLGKKLNHQRKKNKSQLADSSQITNRRYHMVHFKELRRRNNQNPEGDRNPLRL